MVWNTSDSSRFREYNSKSGGRLIAYLRSVIPNTTGKTIEAVALEAKYKEGAEFIVQQLIDILLDENKQDDASSASFTSM
jgi:hypothetical protein